MKTKNILFTLATIVLFFIGLTIYNLIINNQRKFQMIAFRNFDMCFLVASDYKLEKTKLGFKYKLKNNYGEFKVLNRPMSKDLVFANVADVQAGYKKLKNDRVFEYKLDDEHTLIDTFYIIKKRQANLVPLKNKCKDLMGRYPTVMEID